MEFVKGESRSHIENLVKDFAYTTFGNSFVFRGGNPGQLDVCVDIIYKFISGDLKSSERRYILQAPTGSGKSIIAIIVAGVLSKYYKMHGHILVSDISLLDQYVKDVTKYCGDWGAIKGKARYTCPINGRKYEHGLCRLVVSDLDDMITKSKCCPVWECCPYEYAARKAENAEVVVCTYYYWLIHKEIERKSGVKDSSNEFVICDECHNINRIVQDMYSLSVGKEYNEHITAAVNMFPGMKKYGLELEIGKYVSEIMNICKSADAVAEKNRITHRNDTFDMTQIYGPIQHLRTTVNSALTAIKSSGSELKKSGKSLSSQFFKELSWFSNAFERLDMYEKSIRGRAENIIATISDNGKRALLNSTDERYLLDKYFHNNYVCGLFMSATVGGISEFAREIGIVDKPYSNEIGAAEMDSTFDFTYSPIFYCNEFNMKKSDKEISMPHIGKMINSIIEKWDGFRGCVFTSSYAMAEEFINMLEDKNRARAIWYSNSEEKERALNMFKSAKDAVIFGPTLFEGISLDDDLCRFSIIAKVPYPDTTNKLVAWKFDHYGFSEYATGAIQNIIQAVGRGVRNEHDWCNTYILDGGFEPIYRNTSRYPNDFNKRLQRISKEQILK